MTEKNIQVAQIRGNGLSDRETKTWSYFPADIKQTVFSTYKNVYAQSQLPYPIIKLRASSDTFLVKNFYKYAFGRYQQLFGLEKALVHFDIAHTGEIFNYYTYQAVQAKKKNSKLKVVATVWENIFGRFEYNYWPGFKMPPRYWRDRMRHIINTNVKGVDLFLAATNDAAELLFDYGVDQNRVCVVTPGIIPSPVTTSELPASLVGKERYLMVNRLVKEKGVYDVLYAWRRYIRTTPAHQDKILIVVGDGPERSNMMRLVHDWQMNDTIMFIRLLPYNEILALYKGAKALVLGSLPTSTWQEQFGYVLAEAICAGVPIVSTFSGAIPEVVGAAGLCVTPAHPIALCTALHQLDDPKIYARLAAGCVQEKQKFVVEKYAQTVAALYRSLIH